jgi:5-methylcytosine-specific restriction endonuclease McrA
MDRNTGADWHRNKYQTDETYKKEKLERNSEWAKQNRKHKTEKLKELRRKKRQQLVGHLGGKCIGCGVTEDLQFDHINRADKLYTIGKIIDWDLSRILPEVEKCQLLCKECHRIKTRANHDNAQLLKGYNLESISKDDGTITLVYRR